MLTGVRLSGDLRVKKGVESEGYAVWMCQVKDCTVIGIYGRQDNAICGFCFVKALKR